MNKQDTARVAGLLEAALAYLESDDETPIEPEIVRDHIDQALDIIHCAQHTPAGDWLTNPTEWDICDRHEEAYPMSERCPKCTAQYNPQIEDNVCPK